MAKRQMRLSAFTPASSYHQAGWRHPNADLTVYDDFSRWVTIAKKLEAAKFDMIFIADTASPSKADQPEVFARLAGGDQFEPMTLLAALSGHTTHLGLAGTIPTSYRPPYDAARELLSLDRISRGRAGWNIVTGISPDDGAQYADQIHPPQSERYLRGEEFVDVVLKLWASIEPGAYPRNKQTGVFKDVEKIHLINHVGKYYNVRGPLTGTASPQGRPVTVQAGQSEDGRALAARVAEAVFTAQSTFEQAKAFRDDIRSRAAAFGRNPDHLKLLPGVIMVVGESRQEAEDKWAEMDSLLDTKAAMAALQLNLKGVDLSAYALDEPFPEVPAEAVISRGSTLVEAARRENLTLRQVLIRSAGANAHFTLKGTAKDVADELQHWFEGGACDGFNVQTAVSPVSLDDILEKIVPELQHRGLFRTEYEFTTLRENLGIPADPIPLRF
jgi:FMN-dependent oxidoreductase (nitrilotriacetate monooxygenase family)